MLAAIGLTADRTVKTSSNDMLVVLRNLAGWPSVLEPPSQACSICHVVAMPSDMPLPAQCGVVYGACPRPRRGCPGELHVCSPEQLVVCILYARSNAKNSTAINLELVFASTA